MILRAICPWLAGPPDGTGPSHFGRKPNCKATHPRPFCRRLNPDGEICDYAKPFHESAEGKHAGPPEQRSRNHRGAPCEPPCLSSTVESKETSNVPASLSAALEPIPRIRFDAIAGYARGPMAHVAGIEQAYYEHGDDQIVGMITMDRADRDFGGLVVSRLLVSPRQRNPHR